MKIKRLAKKQKTSVSAMVEKHFQTLARPKNRKNLLALLDELPPSRVKKPKEGWVKGYYENRRKKYGP